MVPPAITVRLATLADLEFVQQDHFLQADVVKRKIEWQEVFIAEWHSTPVGYLRIEYLWSLVPYIALIHVLPMHRRKGIGKALLHYLEEFLKAKEHSTLYSSSQVDEVEPQEWHRHVGFKECGIITGINPHGVGEVFFRKGL